MISGAVLSADPDVTYRYALWRRWDERPLLAYVMLNPSTADAEADDATIRVCMGRAKLLGHGGIVVMNLFAFRARAPEVMLAAPDPVGPDNDRYLLKLRAVPRIIAAWGATGGHRHRDVEVRRLFAGRPLLALRLTKDGHPCHPLRIPYSEPLVELPA